MGKSCCFPQGVDQLTAILVITPTNRLFDKFEHRLNLSDGGMAVAHLGDFALKRRQQWLGYNITWLLPR